VPIAVLDDLLDGWENVDFLKMDIQGSELNAFRGMKRILARSADPVRLFEFWPFGMAACGSDPLQLLEEIGAAGFEIWEITGRRTTIEHVSRARYQEFVERVGYREWIHAPSLLCARLESRVAPVLK